MGRKSSGKRARAMQLGAQGRRNPYASGPMRTAYLIGAGIQRTLEAKRKAYAARRAALAALPLR